jgi:hypothetical protein
MVLTASMFQYLVEQRVKEWTRLGIPQSDIALAKLSGIDGRDVRAFREHSMGLILIVRCPKPTAMPFHEWFKPKPGYVSDKSGDHGFLGLDAMMKKDERSSDIVVSDYDMMSVWQSKEGGWKKVFFSAPGGKKYGAMPADAEFLFSWLNMALKSDLQHGAQDDFQNKDNPGVKESDHFAAFTDKQATYLPSRKACADFYKKHGLDWPYDAKGKYSGIVF